jgi:hypothetical protein
VNKTDIGGSIVEIDIVKTRNERGVTENDSFNNLII